MTEQVQVAPAFLPPAVPALRIYPAPWKGPLVLACGKCQKKLKGGGIAKLRRALKRAAREDAHALRLHVIVTPCLDMCPKGGVVVCTQGQAGRGECSIVRSRADVDALYKRCRAEAAGLDQDLPREIA